MHLWMAVRLDEFVICLFWDPALRFSDVNIMDDTICCDVKRLGMPSLETEFKGNERAEGLEGSVSN